MDEGTVVSLEAVLVDFCEPTFETLWTAFRKSRSANANLSGLRPLALIA